MTRKGIVSTADNTNKRARVIFPDLNNSVSPELTVARYVGDVHPNDMVVVEFWSNSMVDGLIIENLNGVPGQSVDLIEIDGGSFV